MFAFNFRCAPASIKAVPRNEPKEEQKRPTVKAEVFPKDASTGDMLKYASGKWKANKENKTGKEK